MSARVPGLTARDGRAYWQRVVPGLGRVRSALACDEGTPEAVERANALNTLMNRGDKGLIRRWSDGEVDILEIVRAVREGDYGRLRRVGREGPRLGEACDDFLERTENTLSPKTYRQYRAHVDALRAHFGDDVLLADITTEQAEAFLWAPKETTKADRPWQASTQQSARVTYGALWRMVIERDEEAAARTGAARAVQINPWKRAKIRKQATRRHAYLLRHEWRDLIRHPKIRDTREATLLALACLAGLRQQEICHLRTPYDVDLDAGLIRIQPHTGGEWPWLPKGVSDGQDNSIRDVPIVPSLRAILENHIRRDFAGARYFMRASRRDRPLGHTTAETWTAKALEAAGLTYGRDDEDAFTLHSLRHTYITWMVSDGVPLPTVAKRAGNTPQVILHTYAHHMPSDDAKADEAIERWAWDEAA
ncbi:MAG: tyrosine-type recombinase/integrase [Gemmatimonadota bacterium]